MPEDGVIFTIQGYKAGAFSYIAVICICHFTRAVHYAAHDGNYHVLETGRSFLYLIKGVFQVIFGASASGACNVLRLVETAPAGL